MSPAEFVFFGFAFWALSAAGGMAILAKYTRGKSHRRRWLILGGTILLPPAWNFGHPPFFVPAWVGVALGLIYNPGRVFQLENVAPFVLYFGGGAAVTALLLCFAGVRGDAELPAAVKNGASPDNGMVENEE